MLGQVLKKRYELTQILGVGGFGQTYIAVDLEHPNHPYCVVKHLRPASSDRRFLKVARRLFDTEVTTLRRLGQHPCIPKLIDSFEEEQEFYLVQEFIDGESLEDEIQRHGRLSEDQTVELLREVLGLLKFVHGRRVIHRDLKPDNLIRRRRDGRLCLIDFGAVKEIRTRIQGDDLTSLTVAIGTQGYTPSEQLAGKPRFNSDIFAAGMTAIYGLTGYPPTELPEDEKTLEPRWENYVTVSPGLQYLLKKMVRYHFYQRYQKVGEVLADLDQLDQLAARDTEANFPETRLSDQTVWQPGRRERWAVAAIALLVSSLTTLGLRHQGLLVPLELISYDLLMSYGRDLGQDPRLLLVEITEADLNNLQTETPTDAVIAEVIQTLQAHQPAIVGLDLHRNIPQGNDRSALAAALQSDNLIGITKLGNHPGEHIPPPEELPLERIGFNDFPKDRDNRIRRNLFFASLSDAADTQVYPSFSLLLALHYLEVVHGLQPAPSPDDPDVMLLDQVRFEPLSPTFGGYRNVDDRGYQTMLTYRSPGSIARRLTLTQVLEGDFDPEWITGKLAMVGTTAYTSRDKFFTPYTLRPDSYQMSGVEIHAQMTSQFLTAVLDNRPLPWAWPDRFEILWLLFWASGGALLGSYARAWLAYGIGLAAIVGVAAVLFSLHGWVPIIAPLLSLTLATAGWSTYRRYRRSRQGRIS